MFWVNDPSTVSPLSADNLSRAERYLTATAGANGDFYVTIPNGANVAAGDQVHISFPAATNTASNARLSLDGGSTYKDIKNSDNITALRMQNNRFTMLYNGTYFIPLELNTSNTLFASTVAAGTNAKGTFPGKLHIGNIITLILTNGNTAAAPTIIIGGVTYTISSMPTVAKLSTSMNQIYVLEKILDTELEVKSFPAYIVEYGTSGNFRYRRWSSGTAELYSTASESTGTLTMTQISTSGIYGSAEMTLALPTGLFNDAGYTSIFSIFSTSYVLSFNTIYSSCTNNSLAYVVLKGGSSTSAVSFRVSIKGTWK